MSNRILEIEKEVKIRQNEICNRFDVPYFAAPFEKLIGIATKTFSSKLLPINGMRHPVESEQSSNWYVWAGEQFSDADDFFEPLHIVHLIDICPKVLRYLGLPPGWRFLFDNQYEDVWYDESLLEI